jgi:hypothetical protein
VASAVVPAERVTSTPVENLAVTVRETAVEVEVVVG